MTGAFNVESFIANLDEDLDIDQNLLNRTDQENRSAETNQQESTQVGQQDQDVNTATRTEGGDGGVAVGGNASGGAGIGGDSGGISQRAAGDGPVINLGDTGDASGFGGAGGVGGNADASGGSANTEVDVDARADQDFESEQESEQDTELENESDNSDADADVDLSPFV